MSDRLRLGVAGLGRGFMLMLPTLAHHPKLTLAAAADPRPEARDQFAREFGARVYATVAELCADPGLDAIYVATPHGMHLEHVTLAARAGKHVLVEKPMALSLADCQAMVEVARAAGIQMVVGHSHSFDAPYLRAHALIEVRPVRQRAHDHRAQLHRLPLPPPPSARSWTRRRAAVSCSARRRTRSTSSACSAAAGSAPCARRLARGNRRARPRALISAFLTFEDGAFATMTYSGYAHFDTDEFNGWIGERAPA